MDAFICLCTRVTSIHFYNMKHPLLHKQYTTSIDASVCLCTANIYFIIVKCPASNFIKQQPCIALHRGNWMGVPVHNTFNINVCISEVNQHCLCLWRNDYMPGIHVNYWVCTVCNCTVMCLVYNQVITRCLVLTDRVLGCECVTD